MFWLGDWRSNTGHRGEVGRNNRPLAWVAKFTLPTGGHMRQALLSVSDKTGIEELAQKLMALGFEILSTGGTAKALTSAGIAVTSVDSVTGFPEILDGRVKTLHPKIHGGILAKRTPAHLSELQAHNIQPIDVVCVNLYPFLETIARNPTLDVAVENIDIGGPAMLRAAAKNFASVFVLTDPQDFKEALLHLQNPDKNSAFLFRKKLAVKAFAHVSGYDAAIANYLEDLKETDVKELLPAHHNILLTRTKELRYGENPHQAAAIYQSNQTTNDSLLNAKVLSGKEMGFNNYADADAAWILLQELHLQNPNQAICVAVKHANPCGVALAENAKEAWERARNADSLSVFGGVIAINQTITLEAAESMRGTFLEVLIAPAVTPEALEIFKNKKPDLRVLILPARTMPNAASTNISLDIKAIAGGFLIQTPDTRRWQELEKRIVTTRQPTTQEWQDLAFAWAISKHARSNNVVLAKNSATVGLGAGAVSRIWAAERAILNAGKNAHGAVLASEAFFPFDDVVRAAAAAGIIAIVQPGGAKRDAETIAACEELNISMVMTGSRHFKH